MSIIRISWLSLLVLLAAGMMAVAPASAQQQKPNILVIMGDDIGYWNISAYNRGMMGYRTAIKLILDNHSAHISRETKAGLADQPGCIPTRITPNHGSWLNLVEGFFSKLARSVLRHIRVSLQAAAQGSPHGRRGMNSTTIPSFTPELACVILMYLRPLRAL